MAAIADLVVHAKDTTPQLIVETKTKSPASAEWAARLRRNLFAHRALPQVPFFLLALPERLYLWKNSPPSETAPPDYEIETRQALRRHIKNLDTPLSALSGFSFESLVRSWLDDVINTNLDSAQFAPSDEWLAKSGLYDAIKHGFVTVQENL
jgi:hypothetical protein